jgi:1,4-dihydroxy-2-naphthoate octaprenyltransferase
MLFTGSVEIPDMEGDRKGGKMTWIVSWGRGFGFKLIAISGLLATISFLTIPLTHLFPSIINFQILAVISLIPLSLGIIGLIKRPMDKDSATKLCIYNLAAIMVAAIMINFYFIYLLAGQIIL